MSMGFQILLIVFFCILNFANSNESNDDNTRFMCSKFNKYEDISFGLTLNNIKFKQPHRSFYSSPVSDLTKGYGSEWIYNSQINDGFCDCCDGSDETSGKTLCKDRCEELNSVELEFINKDLTKHEIGSEKRLEIKNRITKNKQLIHDKNKEKEKIIKEINQIQQNIQKAMQSQNRNQYEYNQYLLNTQYLTKKREIENFHTVYSNKKEMSSLVGQCFRVTLNEKVFKGGSFDENPRDFTFEFCPFVNVTQREVPSKGNPNPDNIILGYFSEWITEDYQSGTSTTVPTYVSYYKGGDSCYNGPERVVTVLFECGEKESITEFREDGKCNYKLRFETQMMCSSVYSKYLKRLINKEETAKDEL